MLWPEGSATLLRPIGQFLEPPVDEPILDIAVSRAGFYVAVITSHTLGLYRLRPLVPVAIYRLGEPAEGGATPEKPESFVKVVCSYTGEHVAVLTSLNRVRILEVGPPGDLEEVLRVKPTPPAGPGEALGAREINLKHTATLQSEDIVAILGLEASLLIATKRTLKLCSWKDTTVAPIALSTLPGIIDAKSAEIAAVSSSTLLGRLGLTLADHRQYVLYLDEEVRADRVGPTAEGDPALNGTINGNAALDRTQLAPVFNLRFGKVALAHGNKVRVYSLKKLGANPIELELPKSQCPTCLEWSTTGDVLFVGHNEGWSLVSLFGLVVYTDTHLFSGAVTSCEWSIGSEDLFVLANGRVGVITMLKEVSPAPRGLGNPVLYGNGRLMVMQDPSRRLLTRSPWFTIPVPLGYLADGWPIITGSASPDGNYVALAGNQGLLCLSIARRSWKYLGDKSISIRGAIVWYRQFLVVAGTTSEGKSVIRMFSPVDSDDEEQILASKTLESPVTAMDCSGSLLVLITQTGLLQTYELKDHDLHFVRESSLSSVLSAPGRVRALSFVSESQLIMLVDDRLVVINIGAEADPETGAEVLRRHTLTYPVEFYFYEPPYVWIYDGQNVTMHTFEDGVLSAPVARICLDAYPTGLLTKKGVFLTMTSEAMRSDDASFWYAGIQTEFNNYLPAFLESQLENPEEALKIAQRYTELISFDHVMETMLFHTLTTTSESAEPDMLALACKLVMEFPGWPGIVAACARKTETKYWPRLFETVGKTPEMLFDESLDGNRLEIASEYLMVMQSRGTAEPGDEKTMGLFLAARKKEDIEICKQLVRFLHAVDNSGAVLREFRDKLRQV